MFSTLLPAFIILSVVAGLAAIVLSIASKKFKVKQDPRIEEILEALPGANCGGCGMAGCPAFAESVVKGEEPVCPVADDEAKAKVAKIMGQTVKATEKTTARVMCSGTSENVQENINYKGINDCRGAKKLGQSSKACKYACYGLGTCVDVCPFDAIKIVDGIAVVDSDKCTSCGKCIEACPQALIKIVPAKKTTTIKCNSNDKGADAKKNCKVACIGCMMCVKKCPVDAITVTNFLAKIDYTKCINCKQCISVCPTKAIKEVK